jgi:hypothetical protein
MSYLLALWSVVGHVSAKHIAHVGIGKPAHRQLVVEVKFVILLKFLFQKFLRYFHDLISFLGTNMAKGGKT